MDNLSVLISYNVSSLFVDIGMPLCFSPSLLSNNKIFFIFYQSSIGDGVSIDRPHTSKNNTIGLYIPYNIGSNDM